ncbi:MAG: T9SS type A sorting domain-containing protein [Bacteroidetes bacterium]|nr:T9SS type A sorting domain-containing protein [Bacteroidota bacterium]
MQKRLFRCVTFCITVLFLAATPAVAQNFIPPTAFEDSWPAPGNPNISRTTHTSCYSFGNIPVSGTTYDLTMAGWDAPGLPGGVSWRMLMPGNPSVVINQGIIPYPTTCQDLEVGFTFAGNGVQAAVAYYRNGVGHFVDVYSWTGLGLTLLYTMPLSTMASYTRISMDSHKMYGLAITWQEKDIKTIVGLGGGAGIAWSGILTLNGTVGETMPDCAFSHTPQAGTLNVHYVYYNPVTLTVTESSYDFWIMIYMLGGGVPVLVNDANFVGPVNMSVMNLDAPDHYDVENWAYTYTPNGADICVRLIDFHTGGVPTTVIVNSGVLGNFPINVPINYNPVVAYDHDCIYGWGYGTMYVGWYTSVTDPATTNAAAYVSLQMDEAGTTLLTPLDYMTVANNPFMASGTPVMSFSKQNDQTNYLYTIFPQYWNPWGGYMMENKYHAWNTGSFKGTGRTALTCNDEEHIKAFEQKHISSVQVKAYPNPFSNMLAITIPVEYANDNVSIVLTDITGKICGTYQGKFTDANTYLTNLSKGLHTGNYNMSLNVEGKMNENLKIVKAE